MGAQGSRRWIICLLAGLALGGAAQAHHSDAMFDGSQCLKLSGTVRTFEFEYPHTWIWLFVANGQGGQDIWGFETADPSTLLRTGWSRATLTPGEPISVVYSPLKDGRKGGSLHQVSVPGGQIFKLGFRPCPGEAGGVNTP